MTLSPPPQNDSSFIDYSASATITTFPHPLPLLRSPLPTSPPTLAFTSSKSFTLSLNHSLSKLLSNCESAARISCALTATKIFQPPWWRFGRGRNSGDEFAERRRCEERESEACLVAAKGKCEGFVRDKCWRGFKDAKVQVRGGERGTEVRRGSDLLGEEFDSFRN